MAEHADEPTKQEGFGAEQWLLITGLAGLLYAVIGALITAADDIWSDFAGATKFATMTPFVLIALLSVAAVVAATRL